MHQVNKQVDTVYLKQKHKNLSNYDANHIVMARWLAQTAQEWHVWWGVASLQWSLPTEDNPKKGHEHQMVTNLCGEWRLAHLVWSLRTTIVHISENVIAGMIEIKTKTGHSVPYWPLTNIKSVYNGHKIKSEKIL